MCKGVVLLIKPICFCLFVCFLFYVLVGVASLYKSHAFPAKQEEVMSFDVLT